MGAQCCKPQMRTEPTSRSVKNSMREPSIGFLHHPRDTMNSKKTKKSALIQSEISDKSEFFSCMSGKDSRRPSTLPHPPQEEEEHAQIAQKSHFAAYASQKNESIYEKESFHQLEQEQKSPKTDASENTKVSEVQPTDNKETTGVGASQDQEHVVTENTIVGVHYKEIKENTEEGQEHFGENDQNDDSSDEFEEAKSFLTGNVEVNQNNEFEGNEEIMNQERVSLQKEISQSDTSSYADPDKEEFEESLDKVELGFSEIQKILANTPEEEKKIFEHEAIDKLVIYSDYSIYQDEKASVSIKAEWSLPCSPEVFIKYVNSFEGLREALNAHEFEQLEHFEDEAKNKFNSYYICYESAPEHQSKDCVFIKAYKLIEENKWCDIFKSVNYHNRPEYEGKFRMNINFGGHLVYQQESSEQDKNVSKVRFYLQFDIKNEERQICVNSIVEKIKHYVERCDKALIENNKEN